MWVGPSDTNIIGILKFNQNTIISFHIKIHLKIMSAKHQPFCFGNALTYLIEIETVGATLEVFL